MAEINTLFAGLSEWCTERRAIMVRANEMMRAGTMRSGSSKDGYTWVDETSERIAENEKQIAELDRVLGDIASREV